MLIPPRDIPDAVPERRPDVVTKGARVAGFERGQPLEYSGQGFLDEILGFHRAARGRRQPAVRPAPQPCPVPIEEFGCGRLVARAGTHNEVEG